MSNHALPTAGRRRVRMTRPRRPAVDNASCPIVASIKRVPLQLAAPLVVTCSLAAQLQTLPAIWHAIDFARARPFVIGGVAGVPIGTFLLPYVPVGAFKAGVGILLTIYCCFLLVGQLSFKLTWGGRIADGAVGMGGGLLGGLAGLSGPLPTIWTGLRGWAKEVKRGVFQTYNLSILTFAGCVPRSGVSPQARQVEPWVLS